MKQIIYGVRDAQLSLSNINPKWFAFIRVPRRGPTTPEGVLLEASAGRAPIGHLPWNLLIPV